MIESFLTFPTTNCFGLLSGLHSRLGGLGIDPVVTLGIPGGDTRLDRIFELIRSSRYSVHDLSRVQVDEVEPKTPRFNPPFELGLAVAWTKMQPARHTFMVFEAVNRRGHKSLSDLAGADFNIHGDSEEGVMRELCSAFVRQTQRPTVPGMLRHLEFVKSAVPALLKNNGTTSVFEARTFADLVLLAKDVTGSEKLTRKPPPS